MNIVLVVIQFKPKSRNKFSTLFKSISMSMVILLSVKAFAYCLVAGCGILASLKKSIHSLDAMTFDLLSNVAQRPPAYDATSILTSECLERPSESPRDEK